MASRHRRRDASEVIAEMAGLLRPLELDLNRAWWASMTDSTPANEQWRGRAELALRAQLADAARFAEITDLLADEVPAGADRRQLTLLMHAMQPHQGDEELRQRLVELETRVESIFNTHRGEVDGERLDDNAIARILAESDDSSRRRAAWEASKSVGEAAAELVIELVHLRNRAARALGYPDHYAMSLAVDELDEERLTATLEEVERVTDAPFRAWKDQTDVERSRRFGVSVTELRPWHYDDVFFQEPPRVDAVDLDTFFANRDVLALTMKTYDGLGLDLRPVSERSDLYGREGKSQHAFCVDMDRAGDVRVLSNVVPNERWAETLLHEFGHAAYDRAIDDRLPFLLRGPAHMITTEAVAMMFGALARDPVWLEQVAEAPMVRDDSVREALVGGRRAARLVFARWALVMCHFERDLYRTPETDHSSRWWDLVERFQLVRRPDSRHRPDWAAKIHLATVPVYYQNYLLGELFAAQLRATLANEAGGIVGRTDAGRLLVERVFRPGATMRWDDLVVHSTGHELTARHLADEIAR